MAWIVRALALVGVLCSVCGCAHVAPRQGGRRELAALKLGPENLTLEVFKVAAAWGDPRLEELWGEVDEQTLPAELRRNLSANGIRAGVVGPHVPASLAQILNVTDRVLSAEERTQVPLEDEPLAELVVLQPMPGKRNELVVAANLSDIAVLRQHEGHLTGNRYADAEGKFDLRALLAPGGGVRLEVVPELHYGEVKTSVTGSANDGVFVWKPQRPKQVYADLRLAATLSPGQMLLLSCATDRPGSIGHHFFAQTSLDKPKQRLWVIRLAQAGADRSFAGEEGLGDRD